MTQYEKVAAAAAQKFRDDNDLGIAPIADIVALIEQTQDVDVSVLDVDDGTEHGLTMVDPERRVTMMAVARSEKPMRWRSTLGHELGHLVFNDRGAGEPSSLSTSTLIESRAQAFARHLLLPLAAVDRFVANLMVLDLAAFSDMVQRFQVSPVIAAIQLRDSGHVNQDRLRQWSSMHTPALAARFGWMDQYRALQAESRQRRSPQRLLARAIAGYLAGVVTIETLASIRGIPASDLAAELREAGIESRSHREIAVPLDKADIGDAEGFIDLSWMGDE